MTDKFLRQEDVLAEIERLIGAHNAAADEAADASETQRLNGETYVVSALRNAQELVSALPPANPDGEVERVAVVPGDPWPETVSDGLTLPCGVCGIVPHVDYTVFDASWKEAVVDEHRNGVVCLECLLDMCPDAVSAIERIQVCSEGRTVDLIPVKIYDYRALRARTALGTTLEGK